MAAMIATDIGEFAAAIPEGGKLAGLDVGTKTIGIAICDAGWHFAGPSETIKRTKFTQDLASLRRIVESEHVVGLVVGLPLNMDGSDSPRTQSVRAFARNLEPLGLPLLLWDERWSTQAVERAMVQADVSRAKRAEKVDALAAAHILQGAIDALANLAAPQYARRSWTFSPSIRSTMPRSRRFSTAGNIGSAATARASPGTS
jgi:putative Holliday junction resolvase